MYIKHHGKVYGIKSKKYIYTLFFNVFSNEIIISIFRIPKNKKPTTDFSSLSKIDRFSVTDTILDKVLKEQNSIDDISQKHAITKNTFLAFARILKKESGL